jgi:hypothetical protein
MAIKKIPILNSGDKFENQTIKNAINGNIMVWQNKPTKRAFGLLKVCLKFLKLSDKPRLNMINEITKGSKYVEIICPAKILLFLCFSKVINIAYKKNQVR